MWLFYWRRKWLDCKKAIHLTQSCFSFVRFYKRAHRIFPFVFTIPICLFHNKRYQYFRNRIVQSNRNGVANRLICIFIPELIVFELSIFLCNFLTRFLSFIFLFDAFLNPESTSRSSLIAPCFLFCIDILKNLEVKNFTKL